MNRLQTISKLAESRRERDELVAVDDWTDEQRSRFTELTQQIADLEVRSATFTEPAEAEVEPTNTPEQAELDELRSRASLAEIMHAALTGGHVTGVTREWQQARSLGEHAIPADAIFETRATSVTIPDSAGPNQDDVPLVPPAFATPLGMAAMVDQRMVGRGLHPVNTITAPTQGPDPVAEAATVGDTTITVATQLPTPQRLQASAATSYEDLARLPQAEDAVIVDTLRGMAADGLDRQVLRSTVANQTGLFELTSTAADGTTETYATYLEAAFDRIDGRYADSLQQLGVILGSATYKTMGATYRASETADNALEWYIKNLDQVTVSAHAPDETNGNEQAALFVRKGRERNATQLIWPNIELIRDPYSQSSEGEIKWTLITLAAFVCNRADGYHVENFDLS